MRPLLEEELEARLPELGRADLDALPLGVVRVDDRGVVELYNAFESQLAGIDVAAAEGRNFFTQVAPCTNNRLLYGRFKEGVVRDQLSITVPYAFTYKMRPMNVFVRLVRVRGTNWVLVAPREPARTS